MESATPIDLAPKPNVQYFLAPRVTCSMWGATIRHGPPKHTFRGCWSPLAGATHGTESVTPTLMCLFRCATVFCVDNSHGEILQEVLFSQVTQKLVRSRLVASAIARPENTKYCEKIRKRSKGRAPLYMHVRQLQTRRMADATTALIRRPRTSSETRVHFKIWKYVVVGRVKSAWSL